MKSIFLTVRKFSKDSAYKSTVVILGLNFFILGVVSIVSFFGSLNPYLELLSHARHVYFLLFILTTISFIILRQKIMTLISACFLLIHACFVVPYYFPVDKTVHPQRTKISFLQLNVQGGLNSSFDTTLKLIHKTDPDVVVLTEVTATWVEQLNKKLKSYPFRIAEPRFGGVALYSRTRLFEPEIKYFDKIKRPRIVTHIKIDKVPIRVIFAHPVIPLKYEDLRNQELEILAKEVIGFNGPVVLLGDLNTTPWSIYFQKLLNDTCLIDSEIGFGIHPTWSSRWLTPVFPIDHFLVSKHFKVIDRKVLPGIKSDHLPVWAVCQLKPKE